MTLLKSVWIGPGCTPKGTSVPPEAALFGNKYELDNVIAFVDRNYLQTDGWSEHVMPLDPLRPKWESFGWATYEIDGHDFDQIIGAVEMAKRARGRPHMIVARTIKGKGVSFMENDNKWHGTPPTREEYERAIGELRSAVQADSPRIRGRAD